MKKWYEETYNPKRTEKADNVEQTALEKANESEAKSIRLKMSKTTDVGELEELKQQLKELTTR